MKTEELLKDLNSFEDACRIEGLDPATVIPDFAGFPEEDRASMIAHAKIVIIVKAANRLANGGQPWKADFTNEDQFKYEALFIAGRGSAGFRFNDDFNLWGSGSAVGSRLCFISREVTQIISERFIDLFNEWMK